jgi:hypothetical protein
MRGLPSPRFNCGHGQAYEQNYGRGQGYGQNFGRGHGYRKKFGRGQDNRQIEYIVYISFDTIETVAPVSTNNLHLT